MAYFARELRYGLYNDELSGLSYTLELVELAKKKGGRPVRFVLYRQAMRLDAHAEMIQLNAETAEEAVRRFWHSDAHGMPQVGNEFPDFESEQWERTPRRLLLDLRSVLHPGTWVRVCIPRHRRRRKKPLQVGNLGHILLAHRERLHVLCDEKRVLTRRLSSLEEYDDESDSNFVSPENEAEYDEIFVKVERLDDEISSVWADITRIKDEMRYKVRLMFPEPMGIPLKRLPRQQSHLAW